MEHHDPHDLSHEASTAIQRIGRSDTVAGYSRVLMILFPVILSILGTFLTWGIEALYGQQSSLIGAVSRIDVTLSGMREGDVARDARITRSDSDITRIGVVVSEHDRRLTILETAALADHERRLTALEALRLRGTR